MTQATTCVAAHGVTAAVVLSPDGKSVAITSSGLVGGTLQLFDIESGTARWKHSWVSITEFTFSADGSLLAVADKGARRRSSTRMMVML